MIRNAQPRPEYPRPAWRRSDWLNLNGPWRFAIDRDAVFTASEVRFERTIQVPFCPESTLSGIGETDFMAAVWYQTEIEIPSAWRTRRLLLHFQAVDYDATVWIDGREVSHHRGCFTPFTVDLGIREQDRFTVTLQARTLRDRNRPRGKQSDRRENYLCCYTRTSGIWQTVWLEPVPEVRLDRPRITASAEGFDVTMSLNANRAGWKIRVTAGSGKKIWACGEVAADAGLSPVLHLTLPQDQRRFWSTEDPFLYDLEFFLYDESGHLVDHATSYAGWRFVTLDGMRLLVNGRPVFQKLVLDQGYYPDGIWTAPDDAALIRDIQLAQNAGFNGARLHQKVFEERFLYHADRLGYLLWGEFGDWGVDWNPEDQPAAGLYQPSVGLVGQWLETIRRDYNHPSIIGWCGLNETHRRQVNGAATLDVLNDLTQAMFLAAKAADPTRPVLDVSGYIHRLPESDVYDCHDYGLPDEVARRLSEMRPEAICDPNPERPWNEPWHGQPFFLSEIGGIAWPPQIQTDGTFSYGETPQTEAEFLDRFGRLLAVIRADRRIFGYCYTQLTDIYQEVNGIYYFNRTPKIAPERIAECQRAEAEYTKTDSEPNNSNLEERLKR